MQKSLIAVLVLVLLFSALAGCGTKPVSEENENISSTQSQAEPTSLSEEMIGRHHKAEKDFKYPVFNGVEVVNEASVFHNYIFSTDSDLYDYNPEFAHESKECYNKFYTDKSGDKIFNLIGIGSEKDQIRYVTVNNVTKTVRYNTGLGKAQYVDHTKHSITEEYADNEPGPYGNLYASPKYSKYSDVLGEDCLDYGTVLIKENKVSKISTGLDLNNKQYDARDDFEDLPTDEKPLRVFLHQILKTDKAYYWLISYIEKIEDGEATIRYTAVKINSLSKYYDEILNFTYEDVILKDGTLIPIKEVIPDFNDSYSVPNFSKDKKPNYKEID